MSGNEVLDDALWQKVIGGAQFCPARAVADSKLMLRCTRLAASSASLIASSSAWRLSRGVRRLSVQPAGRLASLLREVGRFARSKPPRRSA
jgi:hypothetical protein